MDGGSLEGKRNEEEARGSCPNISNHHSLIINLCDGHQTPVTITALDLYYCAS